VGKEVEQQIGIASTVNLDSLQLVQCDRPLGDSFMNTNAQSTTGADAVDVAIAQGIDLDGSPIPAAKLDLYQKVMALEANRQRSGVSNTMRSRIVRIGAKHIPQDELNQMLLDADFAPLKEKEIAFYYTSK
jgi:hypothetical protein